jgi:hypothetical protein
MSSSSVETPIADEWANAVVAVVSAPRDPRTIDEWAHEVGASRTKLQSLCRAVGLSSKQSLELARLLRAFHLAPILGWRPTDLLDVREPRTWARLLARWRLDPDVSSGRWPPAREFVADQTSLLRCPASLALARRYLEKQSACQGDKPGPQTGGAGKRFS